ncbi:AAA family ATPase, partial [candidate division WOR-3 bacterium]|nr:AAA family ATPase [candidate division WOR-3 bacterium]
MRISRLRLKNWMNFREADVKLRDRAFIVGPNASGKSNLLDVFRFLKKVANTGFKEAVEERGGVTKIRSFWARRYSDIEIDVELSSGEDNGAPPDWRYRISFNQDNQTPKLGIVPLAVEIGQRTVVNRRNHITRHLLCQ